MNKKKLIIVLGGGESGVGAALLAKKNGLNVFVSDSGSILKKYKRVLLDNGIYFEEKGHTESVIYKKASLIIKSPGISRKKKLINKINLFKIPMISELEFGKKYLKDSYIISITGSNGKTTTSSIVYKILKEEGLHVGLAGNIGSSFSRKAIKKKDIYVLEVSSFQLDDSSNFRSNIAVLLNITRDHLDRYNNDIENYISSKFKIATHQRKEDIFIYNYDSHLIRKGLKNHIILSKCFPFSIRKKLNVGAYIMDDIIFFREKGKKEKMIMNIKKIPLKGDHNLYNIIASILISCLLYVKKYTIQRSVLEFKTLEHRMEKVLNINGVQFINDSKATNVNSVFYALKSVKSPIIWIAGGKDKGNDYRELVPMVKKKVKSIIFLGKKNEKFIFFFQKIINIILKTESIQEAVRMAYILSNYGDNILLSPACSSLDLFQDYKERGLKFKQEVIKLFYEKNRYI
ncbi:UDP-N-acetylmuramoyl-L-alanine--D-glutamate ligase [Blattabacterium cuenoti]|uniref:UDP-N-acetylmuramoyl-L-alanine--D-glutamate ligase n=1 Tax=Blattabacterium cuenoti TaxID=1653831 RepID=UPI00163CABFE|nr:UDP-N-acetylmuramoyl-L-alanine--D-glutamate ligase [Blattabacterium cuenoti]